MKKLNLIFIIFLSFNILTAVDFADAYQFGSAGNDNAYAVKTDSENNVYMAGSFSSTINFGEDSLTSNGTTDIFLVKFNSDEEVVWATSFGSSTDDNVYEIVIDSDDNVIVSGFYSGTLQIGETVLETASDSEVLVAKFLSTGEFVWANNSVGTTASENLSYGITMDSSGDFIITGEYEDTILFGDSSLTSIGSNDIFVAKISSEGSWMWGQTGGSNSSYDAGEDVICDENDNIFIVGHYRHDATFGEIEVPETGTVCIFTAKLNSAGDWQWVSYAGGSSIDMGFGITINSNNDLYIAGMFKNSATFGDINITGNGNYDAFVAKLDDEGTWLWAANGGSSNHEIAFGIDLNNEEDVVISGRFRDTATFGDHQVTAVGDEDIFCAKISADQEWQWVLAGGGADQDNGMSVTVNNLNQIYFCGFFEGTAGFAGNEFVTNGALDIVLCKATESVVLSANFSASETIGYNPLTVDFTDLSLGEIDTWQWDFQNDGVIDSNEPNPSFTYTEAGIYSVKLIVSNDSDEAELIQENIIHVYDDIVSENLLVSPDSLIFITSESIAEGIEITLDNIIPLDIELQNIEFLFTQTNGYFIEPNEIEFPVNISMEEDFTFTLFPNVVARENIVQDTLRITANGQLIDIPITIDEELVNDNEIELVDFTFSDSIGYNPLTINFEDATIGFPTEWQWDFQNDGIIDSNVPNPSFTYTEAGIYSVKLIVSNDSDEAEIIQENIIHVYDDIVAENLSISPDSLSILTYDNVGVPIEVTIENLIPLDIEIQNIEFIYESNGPCYQYDYDPNDLELPIFLSSDEPFNFSIYVHGLCREPILNDSLRIIANNQIIDIPITVDEELFYGNSNESTELEKLAFSVYPNPFNPDTNISFELMQEQQVNIEIYNVKGQLIKTVVDAVMPAGSHHLRWNGDDKNDNSVGSGMYFAIIKTAECSTNKKLLLLK